MLVKSPMTLQEKLHIIYALHFIKVFCGKSYAVFQCSKKFDCKSCAMLQLSKKSDGASCVSFPNQKFFCAFWRCASVYSEKMHTFGHKYVSS